MKFENKNLQIARRINESLPGFNKVKCHVEKNRNAYKLKIGNTLLLRLVDKQTADLTCTLLNDFLKDTAKALEERAVIYANRGVGNE